MIKCPKCGFEQPEDMFCAHCGINMQKYRAPLPTLVAGYGKSFRSLVIVLVILITSFLLLKSFEKTMRRQGLKGDIDLGNTSQIGVSAGSLAGNVRQHHASTKEEPPTEAPLPKTAKTMATAQTLGEQKAFNLITAHFQLAEVSYTDLFGESGAVPEHPWVLQDNISPILSFDSQDMDLKIGSNTYVYDGRSLRIETTVLIKTITEKEIQAQITYHRIIKNAPAHSNTIEVNQQIPIGKELILIDAFSRQLRPDRNDSILSTLFRSRLFLSHSTDFAQIITIENPRNTPQE